MMLEFLLQFNLDLDFEPRPHNVKVLNEVSRRLVVPVPSLVPFVEQ